MPIQGDHVERDLDVKMVENILESNYNIFSNNDHVELSSKRIETTDSHSKIWRLMGP